MTAQTTNLSGEDVAFGVASGIAGFGIILLALFSMALPIVILTTVALVPLLIIGLVPVLVIGALAAPVVVARRVLRRRHRSTKPERDERAARRDHHVGRAATAAR
jgi:membrane protein implicated in regulation of membrane protease activity